MTGPTPIVSVAKVAGGAWRRLGGSTIDRTDSGDARPISTDAEEAHEVGSAWRRAGRRFRREPFAMAGLVVLVLMAIVSVLAPWIAPFDPLKNDLRNAFASPNGDHWLGTDELGRDVLSRMMFAGRVSLLAAAEAVAVGVLIGVAPGLVAGYFGGRVDRWIMRVADAIMCFPPLILAMSIISVLGPSLTNAMIAVGVVFAPRFLRLVRASVLVIREETYIEAARSIGIPGRTVIARHIVPNILPPLIVQVSLAAGFSMLAEASLSFLGLGVQPPDASWGAMLGRAYANMDRAPRLVILPGIAIALVVLSFNLVGDGLRDSLGQNRDGAS